MAEFCSGAIDFAAPFDEIMQNLLNQRKFSLHLKWLYDILNLWKSELEGASIFEEEEIKIILPNFLGMVCKQFCTNFVDYQCLHRCLKEEVKERYEVYKNEGWKCLLAVTDRASKCKEHKKSIKSETNENLMSKSFTIFSGDEILELECFTEKYEFLLSILFKNKFNTMILSTAMKHRFEVFKLQFPYALTFPRTYLAPPERKSKAPSEEDNILVSILPLQMAQEVDSEFWNIYK